LNAGNYWAVGDCVSQARFDDAGFRLAARIAQIVARFTSFYTLDMAETESGDWILIEINDAQMAAPSEHDLDKLYGKLKEVLPHA
jgi:hypothetical protein